MSKTNPGVSERRDGWLGEPCGRCCGTGEDEDDAGHIRSCGACGGTGEAYDINQDDRGKNND